MLLVLHHRVSTRASLGPDNGVGTGAELGPGVVVANRTRLPGEAEPHHCGDGAARPPPDWIDKIQVK
jgi:hypothetical protein